LWWLGLSFLSGHALFGWIWTLWLPQPYENPALRLISCLLGSTLMARSITQDPTSRRTQLVFSVVFWLDLPVLFSWMYLCNGGNTVWLASVTAMILIYYQSTDWRLATGGLVSGSLLAWGVFALAGPVVPALADSERIVHAVVLAFAGSIALVLNLSSANMRRQQLSHTLTTIGIMAHELRTPLATAALIGDAIKLEVQRQPEHPRAQQLDKLAVRLHTLVRNMNQQIDSQIANARLLQLPRQCEPISAADLVNQAKEAYPYQSPRQRDCVKVLIYDDFVFTGSATQFLQVMNNLIKNALHALMAAESHFAHGELLIQVETTPGRYGRLSVIDEGSGIDAALLPQIFKPFFSNNCNPGHGLGLAFCQQVVQSAGGSIQVRSAAGFGASFIIELPLSHSGV
jgi:two-component system CAI-1 autoinducer sensor kinase/phosphatase CqsS